MALKKEEDEISETLREAIARGESIDEIEENVLCYLQDVIGPIYSAEGDNTKLRKIIKILKLFK